MTRNAFTLLMFALLTVMVAFASVTSVNAQTFSGRGVDMRAIQGNSHSCRDPAMNLQGRLIRLRISIKQILECNEKGGFYRASGKCELALSPGHSFVKDALTSPSNEDTLAFITGGGTALIGGPDGETVTCAPLPSCTYDGTDYEDGDSITLYEQSEVCDEGCIPRVFTCVGDRFSPPIPSDIYNNPGSCPVGPCDGCVDPCTDASLDDGEQTGFVYKDPRTCGDVCTSTNLTCENGTLSNPPSDWAGFVCACPDENCGGCLADTRTWTVSGNTCEGNLPNADDSATETANNTRDGLDGSADFTCTDGAWGPPTNASCEPLGPVICPAVPSVSWADGCIASLNETNAPGSSTVTDNTGDYTGSATYPCQSDGTWGDPTNTSCDGPPEVTCPHPCPGGDPVAENGSITVYENETLSCGQSATPVTLTCSGGSTGFSSTAHTCTAPTDPTGCGNPTCPSPRPNDCPLVGTSAVAPSCCLTDSGAEWRCPLSSGGDPCLDGDPSATWKFLNKIVIKPFDELIELDSECGELTPKPCVQCTEFPAISNCTPGASCVPDNEGYPCVKNDGTCSPSSNFGGDNTRPLNVINVYECR